MIPFEASLGQDVRVYRFGKELHDPVVLAEKA
jgi:hypothetical protein